MIPARTTVLCGLALLVACTGSEATPLLRLEARHLRFAPPSTVPAGLTRVRLVNRDPVWHEASLFRFTDSASSLQTYLDSAAAGNEYPSFARDIGGVSFLGPGDSAEVVLDLPAGRYAVVCWHRDHILQGMGATFTVVGSSSSPSRPDAPMTQVALRDFQLAFPQNPAGGRLLHVTNRGPSEHELAVLQLEPGRTYADFMAWRAAGESGTPPGRTVAGTAALRPGGEIWVVLPRRTGRFLFFCLLEDTSGQYHADLGMQRVVTVE